MGGEFENDCIDLFRLATTVSFSFEHINGGGETAGVIKSGEREINGFVHCIDLSIMLFRVSLRRFIRRV